MAKGKDFITFENVSVRLQEKVLFQNLDWKIKDDEHWAVIGPNGSGKSVLLKAIYGLLPVVKGELAYHFLDEHRESPQEKIAYVTFDTQRSVLGMEAFYQERWNPSLNEDKTTVSDYLEEKDVKRVSRFHVVETYAGKDFQKR
ncbi:MAG TPA: ABC transporter ATP-binding protein, partial [Candidatus Paceibacterota bacterium]